MRSAWDSDENASCEQRIKGSARGCHLEGRRRREAYDDGSSLSELRWLTNKSRLSPSKTRRRVRFSRGNAVAADAGHARFGSITEHDDREGEPSLKNCTGRRRVTEVVRPEATLLSAREADLQKAVTEFDGAVCVRACA